MEELFSLLVHDSSLIIQLVVTILSFLAHFVSRHDIKVKKGTNNDNTDLTHPTTQEIKRIKRDKVVKNISAISSIISFIILCTTLILKTSYTIVPNIFGQSRDSAISTLNSANIQYDINDFKNTDGKVVFDTIPKAGKLIKKSSKIKIYLIDENNALLYKLTGTSDSQIIDSNVDVNSLTTFNTNKLELHLSDIGVYLHTPENPEDGRDLGQIPITNAVVQLIDYNTRQVVKEQTSDANGHVKFEEIPSGTYTYSIVREGQKTQVSMFPFKLDYSPDKSEDILVWRVSLKSNNDKFYKQQFKVKVVDKKGNISVGDNFEVRAIKKGGSKNSYSSLPIYTNKDGYLSLWNSIEEQGKITEYYRWISFQLNEDYIIEIYTENGEYVTLDGSEGKDEYTIELD